MLQNSRDLEVLPYNDYDLHNRTISKQIDAFIINYHYAIINIMTYARIN